MKSSFSAVGCDEVNKSLDHSLLHAVCCVHIFTTQYTYTGQLDTCKKNQKVRPLLPYSIYSDQYRQRQHQTMEQLALTNVKNLRR